MPRAIGIDLGNDHAIVAACDGRQAQVVPNRENGETTPCAVGLRKGQAIVGSLAIDQMLSAPKDAIISIRQLMGRGYRDEEVQRVRGRCQYEVVQPADGTDDDVRVLLGGKEYSPIQISSLILKKLKEDAELRLNDSVESAVITVPAYFTDKQKEATRRAGQLAGLKVQKILDEPTAAAIAFGVDNVGPEDSKTVLVYDLGGGTFDVSVLTIVGGMFAQLNIEGDMWLGGDDFDFTIVDHVVEHVQAVYLMDARKTPKFMVELRKQAEQAKKALSSLTRTDLLITGLLHDDEGNLIDVEMELTRAQFERMISDRVQESVRLVRAALDGAGVTSDQIDHVLLVGGSSSIPLVRQSLAEVFGEKKLLMNVDPMKCVAYGAAMFAEAFAQIECQCGFVNQLQSATCAACSSPFLDEVDRTTFEITGMHYGTEGPAGQFEVIIPKGTPFPTAVPFVWKSSTPAANLTRIKVPIYAGFNDVASQNELQATVWLELPENVPAGTPLELLFSLDKYGILEPVKIGFRAMGSRSGVNTFLDRGDTKRGRFERILEQFRVQKENMRQHLDQSTVQKLDMAYAVATRALTQNDLHVADRETRRMQELFRGVTSNRSIGRENAMSDKHQCKKCAREFLWSQGSPQELSRVEQMICAKENLPFALMKKITCPHCGTQSLAKEPWR